MFSLKLYRFLLNFYPATFRENYAGPLEREFVDEYGESPSGIAVAKLWTRTLADFCVTMPRIMARELTEDTHHALRMWRKNPLPMAPSVLALAIGIGAIIGVFSVVDAWMLRPLPFREAERLVAIHGYTPDHVTSRRFQNWRERSGYLDDAAFFWTREVNLSDERASQRVRVTETSWNLFETMGTKPHSGRWFLQGEDEPGRDNVAVISYGEWQSGRTIGSTVYLNGAALEVIGVAPPGFDYPDGSQIWTPTVFHGERIPKGNSGHWWQITGRIQSGMEIQQARTAFLAEVAAAHQDYPRILADDQTVALVSLRDDLAGPLQKPFLILAALAGLLLLAACGNMANLLASRSVERASELAIRKALGAGRARLIQQVLTESMVLAAAGGLASIVFARWSVVAAAVFQPVKSPLMNYTLNGWHAVAFAVGLVLVVGLIVGVVPAMLTQGEILTRPLASRFRPVLVALEVGFSVVLIAGGAALGYAFWKLTSTNIGFDTQNLISLRVSAAGERFENANAQLNYHDEAVRRLRAVDGVVSVGSTSGIPLGIRSFHGYWLSSGNTGDFIAHFPVGPGFFSTIGTRMLAGRDFLDSDRSSGGSAKLAIVSESYARLLGQNSDVVLGRLLSDIDARKLRQVINAAPVGRERIPDQLINGRGFWTPDRIIGVIADIDLMRPGLGRGPQVFPLEAAPTNFVIRVTSDPRDRMTAIRQAMQSVDPGIPVYDVMTMDERLEHANQRPRFYTLSAVMFAGCAFVLAIAGMYGLISHSVAQRTRDMGIRMALGTTPGALRLAMLREGFLLAGAGTVPAVILTLLAARWLDQLVKGAAGVTALACLGSVVAIAAIAALSIWIATSRIAQLDLSATLRVE